MYFDRFETAGAVLSIDLDQVAANWQALNQATPGANCAAVLKANAYGLGAVPVAKKLAATGCRVFFVAHIDEGIGIRKLLPTDCEVIVLHGAPPGGERVLREENLIPVLNSLPQLQAWSKLAQDSQRRLPALLHVDTGMARTGLAAQDVARLADTPGAWNGIDLRYVMSHLVSAEIQESPLNAAQRSEFARLRALLPAARASLANSSGIFLGSDFHYDLARPGAALYGVAPVKGQPNPMRPVLRLQAKVIQVRDIAAGTPVGYGATWTAARPARIATISAGYADGLLRSLSSRGVAYWQGQALPVVGIVSMDTITLDVSALPRHALQPGDPVDLLNEQQTVDTLAAQANTIGYEILTSLGNRYCRRYLNT